MTPDPLTPSPDRTPRTDDLIDATRFPNGVFDAQALADFARQLERELAALVKEREELLKKGGEEPCRDMNEPQEASAIAETPSARCLSSNAAPTSDPLEAAALRALNFKLRATLAERDKKINEKCDDIIKLGESNASLRAQLAETQLKLKEAEKKLQGIQLLPESAQAETINPAEPERLPMPRGLLR